ncbi:MAG: PA14 domain-containing protein, partial [Ginsengibacter sp.]
VTNFDISQANRSTSYSFNYTGYINVPTDGQYTFYTASDDGSSLYIDNILVVNNDGLHGWTEQSGVIGLQSGKHAISVGYFQQGGAQNLSVSYSGPGISKQDIPSSVLTRFLVSQSQRVMGSSSSAGMDSSAYSISNQLMNTPAIEPGIKAYPNPFNNSINISIGGIVGGKSQLILLDATGKAIWKQDINGGVNSYYKVLNTSSYPNGIYFLEFVQNGKRSVIKLMKQR